MNKMHNVYNTNKNIVKILFISGTLMGVLALLETTLNIVVIPGIDDAAFFLSISVVLVGIAGLLREFDKN